MNHRTYLKITDSLPFLSIPIGMMMPLFIVVIIGISTLWISLSFYAAGLLAIFPLYKYLAKFKRLEIECPVCRRKTAAWDEWCRDVFLVCSHCGEVDRINDFHRG